MNEHTLVTPVRAEPAPTMLRVCVDMDVYNVMVAEIGEMGEKRSEYRADTVYWNSRLCLGGDTDRLRAFTCVMVFGGCHCFNNSAAWFIAEYRSHAFCVRTTPLVLGPYSNRCRRVFEGSVWEIKLGKVLNRHIPASSGLLQMQPGKPVAPSKPGKKRGRQPPPESDSEEEEQAAQDAPPAAAHAKDAAENAALRKLLADALRAVKAANKAASTSAHNEQAAKDRAEQAAAKAAPTAASNATAAAISAKLSGAASPAAVSSPLNTGAASYAAVATPLNTDMSGIVPGMPAFNMSGIVPGMPWHTQQLMSRIEASYQSELGSRTRMAAVQDYMLGHYMMGARHM